MKKLFFIPLLLFIAVSGFGQTKSDLAGTWKIVTAVSNKQQPPPTYLLLNADGTYLWGIDSAQTDPMKSVTKGTWDLTSERDIKFLPADQSDRGKYYAPRGENMYEYDGYDVNGKRTPEIVLEVSLFIQQVK
jgi:hypothetical protein